jgi:hypothetical protein
MTCVPINCASWRELGEWLRSRPLSFSVDHECPDFQLVKLGIYEKDEALRMHNGQRDWRGTFHNLRAGNFSILRETLRPVRSVYEPLPMRNSMRILHLHPAASFLLRLATIWVIFTGNSGLSTGICCTVVCLGRPGANR